MSASLVGSEMCIRDRRRALGSSCSGPSTSGLPPRLPPGCRSSATSRSRSCLLYTSDAADDM
eukprot:873237-Alexandrium_andersonii.AAC.1